MPNPVTPSRVRALIPSNTGSLCERLSKLFQFPQLFFEDVSYKVTEAGLVTSQYALDLCELECIGSGGTGTPNPNMPAPTNLVASDDAYSDKIVLTWDEVTPPEGIDDVAQYKIYRSLATNVNPNLAVLIATVSAPTLTYNDVVDADLVAGTNYIYWVKATNGTDESAFSIPDLGRAATATLSMDPVSDLRASYGFGTSVGGVGPSGAAVALVWTPPSGATSYDVYRGTTAVFADATKIYSNISPAPTTTVLHPTNNPTFWNNIETVLLYDLPPDANTDYTYWVVARKSSPPAISVESNDSTGRVNAPTIYNQTSIVLDATSSNYVVPAGITKMWAVLRAGGGGGAGGSDTYGGAGAGGPGTVREAFTVAPGDVIDFVATPTDLTTTNAASSTNGQNGADVELQINSVAVLTASGGDGGEYSASGGGAGGSGGTATGTTSPTVYDGAAGQNSSGASGGRSGHAFGFRRTPMADAFGIFNGDGNTGGYPGSGAKAISINAAASVGGKGTNGRAFLVFGT